MVEIILESRRRPHHPSHYLRRRYENDMAKALKVMALEGHGIAWLPDSTVVRELKSRQLALAGNASWCSEMEVRLCCKRQAAHNGNMPGKPLLNQVWMYLEAKAQSSRRQRIRL